MAGDKKISQLTEATLTSNDYSIIERGGLNYKVKGIATKASVDSLDAKTVKQSLYADLPTASAGNNGHYYQTEVGIYKSNGSTWNKVAYTSTDLDTLLATKANQSTTYTKVETNTLLDAKQATITASNGVQKVGVDVRGVDATTLAKGVVQLSNTYNGTSQILATTEKALSDGLAIKQNAITTGTTAQYFKGDLSLSNFATDAQNATVEDAINNGITNKAPSENAVFDALALKAPLASPTFTGSVKVPTPSLDSEAVPKSYADGLQRVLSAFGRTGVVTAQNGDYSAIQITNTPAGNISATSVQAAINELDNEKQPNIGYTPENVANKNQVNGYAGVGSDGYIDNTLINPSAKIIQVTVADQAERFTLTIAQVQYLDQVYQQSNEVTYQVIDVANLNNANGYRILSGSVTWTQVQGKPVDIFYKNTDTTDNIIEGTKKFTTASDITRLGGTSGTNTGDETTATIKTKRPIKTIASKSLEGDGNVTLTSSDVGLGNVQNTDTTTTANITDSLDKRFVTDAQIIKLNNTTGVNSGDQDLSGLLTKADNLASVANQQTALNNITNVAAASTGQALVKKADGSAGYQTLATGGNMSANVTGATNKILISLNDTALDVGYTFSNVAGRQSGLSELKVISTYTTAERDSLSWVSGDIIYDTTIGLYLKYTGSAWVCADIQIGDYKQSAVSSNSYGWLLCNGGAISRTVYASLFAIIGTSFGVGDGSTTFNLPDHRGRVSGNIGTGAGLTARSLGATVGAETHQLALSEIPAHSHNYTRYNTLFNNVPGVGGSNNNVWQGTTTISTNSQGGGDSHNNMQPTLFAGNTFIFSGV